MSRQKLVHQNKERDGVAHGVSPPEHGAVDAVDEDFHKVVGAGQVLEQVALRYQVLVSDHSTLLITSESWQDVVENVLLVAKVEEHCDEEIVIPLKTTPESTKCEGFLLHEADYTDTLEAVEKDAGQVDNNTHGARWVTVDKNTLGQSPDHLYLTHQQDQQYLGRREQLWLWCRDSNITQKTRDFLRELICNEYWIHYHSQQSCVYQETNAVEMPEPSFGDLEVVWSQFKTLRVS